MQKDISRETFGYVLKRHIAVIVVFLLLIGLAVSASYILQNKSAGKVNLYPQSPPVDPGLKPIEFSTADTSGVQGTVLTETEPVGREYYSDTLFIGDSFTDGIRIYEEFGTVQTVSIKGINTHSAFTLQFHDIGDGTKLTMVEAIQYYRPRKVYIMLGTNGLEGNGIEWNLEGYETLVDEILAQLPGCYIVIQSLPASTAETAVRRPAFSPENIALYNDGLRDLALRKGVYFLDVNEVLTDEEGYLMASIAASADGIHIKPAGYRIWSDYVLSHVVQGESAYSMRRDGFLQFTIVSEGVGTESES